MKTSLNVESRDDEMDASSSSTSTRQKMWECVYEGHLVQRRVDSIYSKTNWKNTKHYYSAWKGQWERERGRATRGSPSLGLKGSETPAQTLWDTEPSWPSLSSASANQRHPAEMALCRGHQMAEGPEQGEQASRGTEQLQGWERHWQRTLALGAWMTRRIDRDRFIFETSTPSMVLHTDSDGHRFKWHPCKWAG